MRGHRGWRRPCSVPGAEVRTRHAHEHLPPAVHRPAAVVGHTRWVVGRGEQRVDVAGRDRQAEVLVDEPDGAIGVGSREASAHAYGPPGWGLISLRQPSWPVDCHRVTLPPRLRWGRQRWRHGWETN